MDIDGTLASTDPVADTLVYVGFDPLGVGTAEKDAIDAETSE